MSLLRELLDANEQFTTTMSEEKRAEGESITTYPSRHIGLITCMDTRLVNFLEEALGIKRGEACVIKSAGNSVDTMFDNMVKSLLVSIYELGVNEVFVIGHNHCGRERTTAKGMKEKMLARGIREEAIDMIMTELDQWAESFHGPCGNVEKAVAMLKANPLIPKDIPIHGLMVEPHQGKVELIVNGYE